MEKIDQSVLIRLGGEISFPADRIVSLVPSLTESLFYLRAGERLCGRTDYCVRPEGEVESIEKVGGPKSIDIDRIMKLEPNVILASREENEKEQIVQLSRNIPILLIDPESPKDAPLIWRALGNIVGEKDRAENFASEVEKELEKAQSAARKIKGSEPGFIYFVWKDPWIAAGHDTYISKMLTLAGFNNSLADEHRRYPQISLEEVYGSNADAHLYCSEPWAFHLPEDILKYENENAKMLEENWYRIGDIFAAFVDAESISWYPSRAAEGLRYVAGLREKVLNLKPERNAGCRKNL